MADEISAAVISGIEGIGTSAGDDYGLVHCLINGSERQALAFAPEMATPVAMAFLAAAGHLQTKARMRTSDGDVGGGIPIEISQASFAIAKSPGIPDALALAVQTKSGAELHFVLTPELAQSIANAVPHALAALHANPKSDGSSLN